MARLAWRITLWSLPLLWFALRITLIILWRVTRGASLLALAGIGGLVRGVPESTQMMANDWCDLMMSWGISPLTTDRMNPVLRVWGFLLIFMGWVVIGLAIGIIVVWVT